MSNQFPPTTGMEAPKRSSTKIVIIVVLIVCLVIGLPICICGGAMVWGVLGLTSMFKESEPYQTAMTRAQDNQEVVELLGEPIEAGTFPQGSLNLSNDQGDCDLSIPVSGPKGNGTIIVRGTRTGGVWTYDELHIVINSETIELDP